MAALCIACVFAVNFACVCRERFLCSFCGRTWTRTRRWTWKTGRPWGAPPQWRRRNPDCGLWTPSEGQSVPATLLLSVLSQSAGVCSLSVSWRVFIVRLLACVHCQSVGVCSLSVSWRVFIVSQLACVHCQLVRVCSLSIVTVNLVSCSDEGSPSDGQSVLTAPSLSVLCRYGQHGYGTKEKDSPSEDQSVLTTLYLRFDSHYNEPGANHSSSIHLQSVLTTLYLCVDCLCNEPFDDAKVRYSPSEGQSVLTILYLRVHGRSGEPFVFTLTFRGSVSSDCVSTYLDTYLFTSLQ